jgi:ABC-type uncharacterized transport system substrate-binding protein
MLRVVFAGLVLLACVHPVHSYAATIKVALVLSEQGGAYQEFRTALESRLSGKGISVSVTEADKPFPESDLVITAGMKAAVTVAGARPAAMLAVLLPGEGVAKLAHDFPALVKSGPNVFSAIYLDQPLKRQLDLIAAVLPQAHSIGVLYAETPKDIQALRSLAATRKLELNERSSTAFSTLYASLQSLLLSSDVLLALPDAEIYNTMTIRNILLATYRNKVPLIGFSAAYVRAGALCAVFSTPGQIAEQAFGVVQEFAATGVLPTPQYAKEFEVSLNEQVARSLGLDIKSAASVRSEMGAAP